MPGDRKTASSRLGAVDLRILETLQRDGRISNLKLSEEIGLSPSACYERVKRLERSGYIAAYGARLDCERILSVCSSIVTVSLGTHRALDFRRFENIVREIPEIVSCYEVGGGVDYVLMVVTRTVSHYQRIIDALLESDAGIERYTTSIVLREVKENIGYPLQHLLNVRD